MDNADLVLRTRAVSLGYGQHTVLRDVNLEVRAGEFWFFLGPNGSGKTTLLRALLGLIQPQHGQLWLHPELGRRERMGFVPQRCDLNPTLPITVCEFAELGLVGIRISRSQQNERLTWALEKMGLRGMADKDYWSLSGGQRQRVLAARALVRRPAVLVLDEPTNNLDLTMEDTFLQILAALHQEEHNTFLFVTHNLSIATRYATHVGLVAAGTIICGPRDQVLTPRNLEQVYGIDIHVTHESNNPMETPSRVHGGAR
jgi:ABC-type Mn2+/Zn2+ transport system ATPase subunit